MKKRIIALMLSFLLLPLCFTACGKQQKKITLVVKTRSLNMTSYADESITSAKDFLQKAIDAFKVQYADSDVEIVLEEYSIADIMKSIDGNFGKERAVDVLYEGYLDMSSYIHTGRMIPLDDIVTDKLREDIDERYWSLGRATNGKMYMMPYLSMQNTMSFRYELFDSVETLRPFKGGEDDSEVQNWSYDEWETVLAALKAYYGEDMKWPMMAYAKDNQGDTHFMTLLRSRGCSFYGSDGKVNVDTPEGRAALTWLRECYVKGYFPNNAAELTISDNYNYFISGQLGLYVNNPAQEIQCENEGGKESAFSVSSVNFPSVDGKGLVTSFVTGFGIFDNGNAAKLRVAKDFVKFVYESDCLDYSAGSIPCSSGVAQKYRNQMANIIKYVNNTAAYVNYSNNHPNWSGVRSVFHKNMQDVFGSKKSIADIAAQIDKDCNEQIEIGYKSSELHA